MIYTCEFIPNFDEIYDHYLIQSKGGGGRLVDKLGDVWKVAIVGRKYKQANWKDPFEGDMLLMEDDENEMDPNAVMAVYRGDHIGYVVRDRAPMVRMWIRDAKRAGVVSPTAVYFFERLLF